MLLDQLLHVKQGVRAVVTLNEDFEVFISTEQYKVWWLLSVAQLSCKRLASACCVGSCKAAHPSCPAAACRHMHRRTCRPYEAQNTPGLMVWCSSVLLGYINRALCFKAALF